MVAFVEEDGSGLVDATSYTSIVFSDDYLGSAWLATQAEKETALIRASEYIDARWGFQLLSEPLVAGQALEFPRAGLVDRYDNPITGVPLDLQKATCLYAELSASGALYPATSTSTQGGDIKKTVVQVGPIREETEFTEGSTSTLSSGEETVFLTLPLPDALMKQFTGEAITDSSTSSLNNPVVR